MSSAEQALRQAAEQRPGVVIADLVMPGLNGFEFIGRFRRLQGCAAVPIVVWTVKDLTEEERLQLESAGAVALSKSEGSTSVLIREVRAIFERTEGV